MADILLVEPNIKLGQIYQTYLNSAGHQVRWCSGAQAALNKVDQLLPDLIVLELQLIGHNGIEFLYELRSYQDWQDIPVLVHSQVPPLLKALSPILQGELGVRAYCYKPATKLRDLLRSVENLSLAV